MISVQSKRIISGTLCVCALVLLPLLVFGVIDFSGAIAFPMHIGIIGMAFLVFPRRGAPLSQWSGKVPRLLKIALPLVVALGIGSAAFGFIGAMPDLSPSGKPVHHLNAYLSNGNCYANFNKEEAIRMDAAFCENFTLHFATAFCGAWLIFSALVTWGSWKCNDAH